MKKLICKLFGCNWKYFFSGSNYYNERTDVRVCKCCNKIQHYMKIVTGEFIWMNMVGFTKLGAKKYWNDRVS